MEMVKVKNYQSIPHVVQAVQFFHDKGIEGLPDGINFEYFHYKGQFMWALITVCNPNYGISIDSTHRVSDGSWIVIDNFRIGVYADEGFKKTFKEVIL